jgi:tetratricopeptide (TPR) repeat protein
MKPILALLFLISSTLAIAESNTAKKIADLSPAEERIVEARKTIEQEPTHYAGYNLLAVALVRRAQQTADPTYYLQAQEALRRSIELAPNNFETEKIRVTILLGEYEFPEALSAAKALNKRVPDDVMVYGLLARANMELGNYKDAENAAQWMLNLRPGNLPALTHAAHLRELFGDADGSYELLEIALETTSSMEVEENARILTEMGHLRLAAGNPDAAEKLLQRALACLPGYGGALGNLAQVRIAQKRYEEAVVLLRQRYQVAPALAHLYDLAEGLELAGHSVEAHKAFQEFETKALALSDMKDNANRDLVFYYADHAQQPAKALQIAHREFAWRHDVYTLDAYAWALHASGQDRDARQQIEAALAVGVRDANLFRHAGEIALTSGDRVAAEHYLAQSAELNSLGSEQARASLARLSPVGP